MAERFQSLHQALRGTEDVALVKVVCTEILVKGSALQHVIADGQNGVGDRNNRPLGSACGRKPTELGGQGSFSWPWLQPKRPRRAPAGGWPTFAVFAKVGTHVGTSNRIVARVLLQGNEILNSFLADEEKKNAIRRQLHRCKELLVCCETVANRVDQRIEEIEQAVKQTGVPIRNGRVLNPLPQVENLEADCGTFLLEANRAIRVISGLPSLFISLDRADKNFDHLRERLSKAIGDDQDPTKFVAATAPVIRRLADMRNYFEHPAERKTVVKNIHVLSDGTLSSPIWQLSGESPMPIGKDMLALVDFLVRVSEEMLIHLVLYCGRERFAFHVQATPDEQMDRNFPVKYKILMFFKPPEAASRP